MDTRPETKDHLAEPVAASEEKIEISDRLLMCLFAIAFLGLGLFLVGDLLLALWRYAVVF